MNNTMAALLLHVQNCAPHANLPAESDNCSSTDLVGNIPLRKLNLNFKNKDDIKKSVYHPRSIYSSRPTQSYHFQADLNWCDGTFKY